jgi:NHLM bacteriocin system ABC transporter peptidase/ATP-binding protein
MALTWWQRSLLLQLENRISIRESRAFIRHLLRLPVSFYLQRSAGEVASRVAINDRLARLLSGDLARSGLSLILVCVYLAVMVWYDPVLALIGAIIAALNFLVLRFVARARRDAYRRLLEAQGKLTGSAMAAVHSIDSIKASGTESDFFARLAGQHTHANNTEQELGVFTEVLGTAPLLLAGVSSAVVLAVGGLQVMEGHLSVGTLVGFQVLLASFLAPVAQLVSTGSQLQELEAATNRLDDALRHHVDPELASVDHARTIGWDSAHRKPRLRGHVQMQHISFGYSQMDPPTIIDLNLDIEPGRKVAIIGATGSGKSTIARLLVGLYQPWEGEILFDGQPRAGIPREVLNSSVALVDQDIVLFHGTVRDNLTLWDRSIPDTDIVRAARDACIHGDITARPGGYELVIEEGGRNLSGGQAQRLEIARALVRNPAVLVLDEATSALDALTEHDVMTNVIHRGCTCIIVAHRLSTIRDCDEIIVLESGRPVQRGTHEDMTKDDGPYTRLIRSGSLDNGNTSSETLLGTSG